MKIFETPGTAEVTLPDAARLAARKKVKEESKIRTGSRILLSRLFVSGVIIAILFGESRWVQPESALGKILMMIGLVLSTLAMAGRIWCSLFIAGRKNSSLVIQGPYALCRNPLYFFSFIGVVGVTLASGMATVTALVVLGFSLYYPMVIRREELLLQRVYQQQFLDYRKAVPSFWPRLRNGPLPEEWICHPRIFLRHLGSALWFPIACGAVYCVAVFRTLPSVPAWFKLY